MDVTAYILAKKYVDSKVAIIEVEATATDKEIVDTLPETGEAGKIYLVPLENGKYAEYVWKDNSFVKLKEIDVNSSVTNGYYYNGKFYEDAEHTKELKNTLDNLYIDKQSGQIYYYDVNEKKYKGILAEANDTSMGVVKMYGTEGENTDGTMKQKAIKETIDTKITDAFANVLLLDGGSAE